MAKDLPYFKFFVSEWSDGDVTLEDYTVQGVFINVCAYYWSNGCDVSYEKLCKKFKGCDPELTTLENTGIIKIEGEEVFINFLDEQLGERGETSVRNSKAGKASAEARRLKKLEMETNEDLTRVEIPLNENPTIKRREEKRREDIPTNTTAKAIDFVKLLNYINTTFGRQFRIINDSIKTKYKARIKEGYTNEDIKTAIDNCRKSKHHIDTNFKYCTPEFFTRSVMLDKYSSTTEGLTTIQPQKFETLEDVKNLWQ